MSQRETVHEASNDMTCERFTENQSLSSFNLLKTSTLQQVYNNAHVEKEAAKEYMNEYQEMLLDFMRSLPLADNLKDELYKCVLASNVNCVADFIKAKNVLFKITMDIKVGTLTVASTLRSVFVGAYGKAVRRLDKKLGNSSSLEETANRERPVPFYNWLNERNSRQQIEDKMNLENWLI